MGGAHLLSMLFGFLAGVEAAGGGAAWPKGPGWA
jgi:hypothetical protein